MARLIRFFLLTGCALILTNTNNLFAAISGGACPSSVPTGITKCYYADFVNGVDTNAGTSESAPWQHFPGMAGCTNNCKSNTPVAGEGFILKGGVAWTNAALGWYWIWSGTGTTSSPGCNGSGCIYIGVDPAWFTGASWSRPILNAGGTVITGGSMGNTIFGCYCNDLVLDNLEFTGLYWSGLPSYGSGNNVSLAGGSPGIGTNDTFEHLYIHGWSHGSSAGGTVENPCGFTGDTSDPNNNTNTILEYSVISGADTAKDSCSLVFGGPPYIAYNVLEYGSSAMIIDGTSTVHDNIVQNVVTSFDSSAHENGMEINYSKNVTVYNNIFRHIGSGSLTVWLAPDGGSTAYFFNNVIYDTDVNNVIDLAASLSGTTGTDILWNNTVECGPDSNPNAVCADNISSAANGVILQNNHFITNAGSYWSTNGVTPTLTTNLLQTKSTANGLGYSAAQTHAFSPTTANVTVGAGTNVQSSRCSSVRSIDPAAAGVACQSDTTYGVTYNTTNHTVTSPGRTPSAWKSPPDVGAYSFGLAPSVPQDLQATPQ